jgi:hypothetical protein
MALISRKPVSDHMTKHIPRHAFWIPEDAAPRLDGLNYTLDPGADAIMADGWRLTLGQIRAATALFEARHAIANEIERLMALLDATEPDDDLELNLAGHCWRPNPALDDAECDLEEAEPSLSASAADADVSQERWAEGECGWFADCEDDPAESGIADLDGLLEQHGAA